jgi:5-methylcytosine-specific restriction endonuclease McrA
MSKGIYTRTEKHRTALKVPHKVPLDFVPWNKGIKLSEKIRNNIRDGHIGLKHSSAVKNKIGKGNKLAYKEGRRICKLPSHKGEKLSQEHINKIRDSRKDYKHSEKTKEKMKESRIEWLKKHPEFFCSENFPKGISSKGWKGGITPITKLIRHSSKYKQWQMAVRIKKDFTCKTCKEKGGYLHVHHIKPFSILLEEIKQNLPLMDLYEGAMQYTPMWDVNNGEIYCKKCHEDEHERLKKLKKENNVTPLP